MIQKKVKYHKQKMVADMQKAMEGHTVRTASKAIGIGSATVSRIQNGGTPDLINYAKVCKFLGCSLDKYVK